VLTTSPTVLITDGAAGSAGQRRSGPLPRQPGAGAGRASTKWRPSSFVELWKGCRKKGRKWPGRRRSATVTFLQATVFPAQIRRLPRHTARLNPDPAPEGALRPIGNISKFARRWRIRSLKRSGGCRIEDPPAARRPDRMTARSMPELHRQEPWPSASSPRISPLCQRCLPR
jgi:hypothetical protein